MKNGTYEIDVTLTGGSGKASIASPCTLYVENGEMTAEITWNSSNYDYMKIGDCEYFPVNEEGNSVFHIDVAALDSEMDITAQTVAMSKPRLISYTLEFHSDTIRTPLSAMHFILAIGGGLLVLAAAAAVVTCIRKRKKQHHEQTQ